MGNGAFINIGTRAVFANYAALSTIGNNIANANTPGYAREKVLYTPAPVQKIGKLTLGLGVNIAGIVQGSISSWKIAFAARGETSPAPTSRTNSTPTCSRFSASCRTPT